MAVARGGEKNNTALNSVSSTKNDQPPKKNTLIGNIKDTYNFLNEKYEGSTLQSLNNIARDMGIMGTPSSGMIDAVRDKDFKRATKTLATDALLEAVGGVASRIPKVIRGIKSLTRLKNSIKIKNPVKAGEHFDIPSFEKGSKKQPIVNKVTKDGTAVAVSKTTGKIDAVVTGTDDKNVVGIYRYYVKGKPTNDFTSKMEFTNPNLKKNFKTILNNTLKEMPKDHRLIEKTSVSIDGLGVWNKFVKSGKYKEAVDANGKVLTRKVYLAEGVDKKITRDFRKVKELKKFIEQAKSKYPGISAEIKKNISKLRGKELDKGVRSIDVDVPILVPK